MKYTDLKYSMVILVWLHNILLSTKAQIVQEAKTKFNFTCILCTCYCV